MKLINKLKKSIPVLYPLGIVLGCLSAFSCKPGKPARPVQVAFKGQTVVFFSLVYEKRCGNWKPDSAKLAEHISSEISEELKEFEKVFLGGGDKNLQVVVNDREDKLQVELKGRCPKSYSAPESGKLEELKEKILVLCREADLKNHSFPRLEIVSTDLTVHEGPNSILKVICRVLESGEITSSSSSIPEYGVLSYSVNISSEIIKGITIESANESNEFKIVIDDLYLGERLPSDGSQVSGVIYHESNLQVKVVHILKDGTTGKECLLRAKTFLNIKPPTNNPATPDAE